MTGPLSDVTGLFAAVDVHYLDDASARAALVAARDPQFSVVTRTQTALVDAAARYRPGEFYLRELPPLRAVIPAAGGLALIVVDGYVDLDPAGRPGLGAHVHAEFGVPVVGVAKSPFRTATHAIAVCRGQSSRPGEQVRYRGLRYLHGLRRTAHAQVRPTGPEREDLSRRPHGPDRLRRANRAAVHGSARQR